MRTWLSKANGYVSEKPNDAFTGVLTLNGEMIFEGEFIKVTIIRKIYGGVNKPIKETSETHTGFVKYSTNGRFYILGPNKRYTKYGPEYETRIELYHDMTGENNYMFYKIEKI